MLLARLTAFSLLCSGCANLPPRPAQRLELQHEAARPRAFLISSPTRNDGGELERDLFPATRKISAAVLSALEDDQRLYFLGPAAHFSLLASGLAPGQRAKLVHVEARPYYWLQDLFETYRDPAGKLVLGVPSQNAALLPIAATAARALGGEATVVDTQMGIQDTSGARPGFEIEGVHGSVGGNVERWTPELGFVGLSDFPDEATARQFSERVFTPRLRREVLPTSWLYLGHLDEVVKPVKFEKLGQPGCRITALVASPAQAMELLRANPTAPLHEDGRHGNRKTSDVLVLAELCNRAGLKPCRAPTWRGLASSAIGPELRAMQVAVATELGLLRAKVAEAARKHGGCEVAWIEAPQLYLAELDARGGLVRRGTRPLFPNPTNGLAVNSTYVVLDPGNALFREHLRRQLARAGLKASFVEAGSELHGGGWSDGYLHCMTQVVR